jgi:hypothetical protein
MQVFWISDAIYEKNRSFPSYQDCLIRLYSGRFMALSVAFFQRGRLVISL